MNDSRIFLDTVGLIALWDRSDQWHAGASQAFQSLARQKADLFTSSLVLVECANAAARRPYRAAVAELRQQMEADGRVFHPQESDWESVWTEYQRGPIGGPGVVDLFSFRAMRQLSIERAFTNDRHFSAAGFQVLF